MLRQGMIGMQNSMDYTAKVGSWLLAQVPVKVRYDGQLNLVKEFDIEDQWVHIKREPATL